MSPTRKNLIKGYLCLQGLAGALVAGAFPLAQLVVISLLTAAIAFVALGSSIARLVLVSTFALAWGASAWIRLEFFEVDVFRSGATPWFFANLAFVFSSAILIFVVESSNTKQKDSV